MFQYRINQKNLFNVSLQIANSKKHHSLQMFIKVFSYKTNKINNCLVKYQILNIYNSKMLSLKI